MFYLTQASEIQAFVLELASHPILWLDTEVADCNTPSPKLSLIQVLAEPNDLTGDSVYILDVLEQSDITQYFITQIMVNAKIEKVFHNASFDLKYLGSTQAQNITCTYKIARDISRDRLGTSNLQLKTLARELCQFTNVDDEEGRSDWGRRPLSKKQLEYAKMDTVYLAQVYFYLKKRSKSNGQLTLEYQLDRKPSLSEVYGDNSDRINLPMEPENFLNPIPNSKFLKEKCQELIELSQRKTELTKYAKQIDGFTGRQAKITNFVREISPLIVALRTFKQKGIIHLDLNQKVEKILTNIKLVQENFQKYPEWILDNNNFKISDFNSIENIKNTLKQNLSQAWKNYLAQQLRSRNKEILKIFSEIESLKPTIQRIDILDRQIQEIDFPKNSQEFDRVEQKIEQLNQSLDNLSSDKIPQDVQNFLKAAAHQGATLDLLTPEVKEWLIEHRLAQSVRIRLT